MKKVINVIKVCVVKVGLKLDIVLSIVLISEYYYFWMCMWVGVNWNGEMSF